MTHANAVAESLAGRFLEPSVSIIEVDNVPVETGP